MTLDTQFMTIIVMILGGFYLGMANDTYRRFKPYWQRNWFMIYFMEVIFWMVQVLILFYILYSVNAGELRFYVFVACFLGIAIYHALAQTIYRHILEGLIKIISTTIHFIQRIVRNLLIRPIVVVVKVTYTILLFVIHGCVLVIIFCIKVIWFPIRWIIRLFIKVLPKPLQKKLHHFAGFYSTIENIVMKGIDLLKRRH